MPIERSRCRTAWAYLIRPSLELTLGTHCLLVQVAQPVGHSVDALQLLSTHGRHPRLFLSLVLGDATASAGVWESARGLGVAVGLGGGFG